MFVFGTYSIFNDLFNFRGVIQKYTCCSKFYISYCTLVFFLIRLIVLACKARQSFETPSSLLSVDQNWATAVFLLSP